MRFYRSLFAGRLPVLPLVMALLAVTAGSVSAAVWTDQADYVPGSVVTISGDNSDGAGFLAGETVLVSVLGPNGYSATCIGTVDDSGAFTCQITLWNSDLAVGDYTYTATGGASGVTQAGAFTDAPPVPVSSVAWTGNGLTGGAGTSACDTPNNDDLLAPVPGQKGWVFVLPQINGTPADWRLDVNFGPGTGDDQTGLTTVQVTSSVAKWAVYSAIGATLDGATAYATGAGGTTTGTLVVSHCANGEDAGGKIIIEKQTEGGDGDFDFTGDVAGTLSDDEQAEREVAPGSYESTETVPAGWDLTDITCDDADSTGDKATATASFEVAAGETVTCVFTNTKRGKIIIEKQTEGGDGDFDFTGDVAGTLSDDEQAEQEVVPGSYESTETVPAGWELTDITCDDADSTGDTDAATASFEVEAGETVTCVFTNTKSGRIIIVKRTTPATDPAIFDFNMNYGDGDADLTGTEQDDSGPLPPATYEISETVPDDWDLVNLWCQDGELTIIPGAANIPGATATVDLPAGETITCVFVNQKRVQITVKKITIPVGASQQFDFDANGTYGPTTYSDFNLGDGQQNDQFVKAAPAGTYSVREIVPDAWNMTGVACTKNGAPMTNSTLIVDVLLAKVTFKGMAPGDKVICTFENTADGATRTWLYWSSHLNYIDLNNWWTDIAAADRPIDCATTVFDKNIDTDAKLMGGFWSSLTKTTTNVNRTLIDRERMKLVQQLQAAILNKHTFNNAGGDAQIAAGIAAYCGASGPAITAATASLAAFNASGDLVPATVGVGANANAGKAAANKVFWDALAP